MSGEVSAVSSDAIVIVGGGQAAVQACLSLRKEKVTAPVIVLSEESEYPYHRPPLSKSYLSGETDDAKLTMRPAAFYESRDVHINLNHTVTSVNAVDQVVSTQASDINYGSLILATGARPRPLLLAGADLEGVHLLRDVQQSRKIKQELETARNVVVIGAGFIGLEFAAVARSLSVNDAERRVSVFEVQDRVMSRAVSAEVSSWFEQMHRDNGIEIHLQESVTRLNSQPGNGGQKISSIVTASGREVECDLLLVGIGVEPNVELALEADMICENGIRVNEFCETSAPNVFAIGDCAFHPNPFYGNKMIRLESVQNATDQARTVAAAIAGRKKPYHSVPWFWSDQGEHSLQMTGLSDNADLFVRRDGDSANSFSVFHFSADRLQSVDSVNCPRHHMLARKLISELTSPTPEQVADPQFDLKSLIS